jgi:hypothetical protein
MHDLSNEPAPRSAETKEKVMDEWGGIGGYDEYGFYETPGNTYDTFGDQVAVDGYESGALTEDQMANEFSFDAQCQQFDDNLVNTD